MEESAPPAAQVEHLAELGQQTLSVVHEIKNPLTGIYASARLLKNRLAEEEDSTRFVDVILTESERLARMLKDILAVGKPIALDFSTVDVRRLLDHVRRTLENAASEQGIALELDFGPAGCDVTVDVDRMQQVLVNLLVNAMEATSRGGRVVVRMRVDAAAREVSVEIIDSGEGFTHEALAHAFDMFYTTKPKGTGLGLSVARRIVESHGGVMEIENSADGGAMVGVRLPQASISAAEHVPSQAAVDGNGRARA